MTKKQNTKLQAVFTVAHADFEKGLNVHAFFKVQNHITGEGLVQDTFIKTWSYLAKGGKIEKMKSFLYHILNDLIIDEYRKRKLTSLDTLIEKGFDISTEHTDVLFNILDGKAAFLLIELLPEKYKKIIKMRYIEDLSIKEMSVATGQTKNTMTVQVHRGLEKLKLLYHNRT